VLNKSLRNVKYDWLKLGACEAICEKRKRRVNAGAAETEIAGEHERILAWNYITHFGISEQTSIANSPSWRFYVGA